VNFTIYNVLNEKVKVGDIIKLNPFEIECESYKITTHIEDFFIFCIVTEIRNNNSVCGKLLNGSFVISPPNILNSTAPYSTTEYIHFMWSKYKISDIDIKNKYPELLLQG